METLISPDTMISTSFTISRRPSTTKAFTLAELLAVIGIMAVLATAAMPSLKGILGGSNSSAAPLKISSYLEYARQYATANNTYVYVSFLQVTPPSQQPELWVSAVSSNSGADISKLGTAPIVLGNGDEQGRQMGQLIKIPGIIPVNTSDIPNSVVPRPQSADTADLKTVTDSQIDSIQSQKMPVSFWFAPDGTAARSGARPTQMELAIQPPRQNEAKQVSVLQVSGLTGSVRTYRIQ
jgi:prepilin-type N-terminal cleavage/methylation domain-containing protein